MIAVNRYPHTQLRWALSFPGHSTPSTSHPSPLPSLLPPPHPHCKYTHTHQSHRPTRPPPASNSVLIIHRLNEIPALNLYGPSVGYKDSTPCLLAAWAYAKEGPETTSPAAIAEASIIQSAESINRIWVLIEFRFNLSLPLLLLSTHTPPLTHSQFHSCSSCCCWSASVIAARFLINSSYDSSAECGLRFYKLPPLY